MKQIHKHLTENHFWYKKWHEENYYKSVHWVILLFFIFVFSHNVFYVVAKSIDTPVSTSISIPYSESDFTGYDTTGKIDTAIDRKLEKQDKVSVIVRLNLPSLYYNVSDKTANRADKLKAFNKTKTSISNLLGENGKIKLDLKIINGLSIDVNKKALESLKNNPNVISVDLDREVKAFLDTSTDEINAPYAWVQTDSNNNTLTGHGIRIAIIDTGVDYTHPDLGGCLGLNCKVIGGYDFVNNDNDPMDDQGHGTHVAATAAGKGLFKGVAPDASIIAYKVLDAKGFGSTSSIVAAMTYAIDPNQDGDPSDHVDVVNMSLGVSCWVYTSGCGPDDFLSMVVNFASTLGVTSVVAAGNEGFLNGSPGISTIGSPGTASSAITVAAACKSTQIGINSNCTNSIALFSSAGPVINNQGVNLNKPDISAPGVAICAARLANSLPTSPTCYDSGHVRISGTSMATPHIAGVVALIKQANPNYTPEQIKSRIKDTARLLPGMIYDYQGSGMVDVQVATSKSCVTTFSDTFLTPNTYYKYPDKLLEFASSNIKVAIPYNTNAAPNKFTVRKLSDNTIVAVTRWMGSANYSGPWGASLRSSTIPGIMVFKTTERNYKLEVETSTGPTTTDSWNVGIGCAGSPPLLNSSLDITPPSVFITDPSNGATVSGVVNISATATDNTGVNSVYFSIGNDFNNDTTVPYSFSWDTRNVPDGKYYLIASASDFAGNLTRTPNNAFWVNVYNYTPPIKGSCFVADTLVILADGSTKNIQDIKIGDILKGDKTNNTVLSFHRPILDGKTYSFNGGRYFVTEEHPFKTTDGWKSINPEKTKNDNLGIEITELKVGDILITDHGFVKLYSIDSRYEHKDTPLFNLILDGDHTYYADGYLVHNKIMPDIQL